jgi:hypothetical protein
VDVRVMVFNATFNVIQAGVDPGLVARGVSVLFSCIFFLNFYFIMLKKMKGKEGSDPLETFLLIYN